MGSPQRPTQYASHLGDYHHLFTSIIQNEQMNYSEFCLVALPDLYNYIGDGQIDIFGEPEQDGLTQ